MDRSGGAGHSVKNPIGSSGGSGNLDVNAPFNAWNGSTGSGGGLGRQLTQFLFTASQKYVLYDFNPALVPATHIQFFGVQGGAPYCDIYPTPANTSPITVGTGSYLADHSAMAGSFWGSVGPVLPINGGQVPPVNYRIQIYNKDASTDMYLSGFFLFNGDALAGVRVHNCGIGSATTAMWANETITQTSHAQMALSSADGNSITTTSNCRLIIMLGANDWTGRTKAQFKVDVTTLVNWAGTLASAPSCMLVMQTPRFDGTADAWRSVMQFRDALKEICDDATLGAYTCLYDSWKYYNYLSPQAISSRFAAIQSDKVHPTASGHLAIARGIAANLIPRTAEATF